MKTYLGLLSALIIFNLGTAFWICDLTLEDDRFWVPIMFAFAEWILFGGIALAYYFFYQRDAATHRELDKYYEWAEISITKEGCLIVWANLCQYASEHHFTPSQLAKLQMIFKYLETKYESIKN